MRLFEQGLICWLADSVASFEWQRACVSNLWIQLVSQAARPPLFSGSFDIQNRNSSRSDLLSVEKWKTAAFRPEF